MKRVGLVGWRGMVGSVLMQRIQEEHDFAHFEPVFFSTSNAGGNAPAMAKNETALKDANDIEALKRCDIILTCQGGDYTTEVFPKLRTAGWQGYWIDAASSLRMKDDAIIVLDPINLDVIKDALGKGVKNYIGGNCTVSCMLMGLGGLFKHDRRCRGRRRPCSSCTPCGSGTRSPHRIGSGRRGRSPCRTCPRPRRAPTRSSIGPWR